LIVKDQLNREVILNNYPKRIISLVPSQTELLVDLGLEKNIIGITKFCVHPKYLTLKKTIIGGSKKVNYKKIKRLQPGLIIANKEENTEEIVENTNEIAPTYVSDILTIADSLNFISDISKLCNVEENAQKLVDDISTALTDFKKFIEVSPSRKVAYFIWHKPWMVVGGNNYINEILKLNNFNNIFEGADRYPEVYVENLSDLKPDLILLSSEPFPFSDKHIEELKKHVNSKIILVDGEMFSWHGSRLLKGLEYFKSLH